MKLVILDRDGVINQDRDDYVKSEDEWVPIPGSLEAIARLNRAGYRVAVATNQSGLARGLFDIARLNAMHDKMHRLLNHAGGRVDAVFFCAHLPEDRCACRKPAPGMLLAIGDRFQVPLANVPVVGDRLKDLQAGVAVGARPHLVLTGKGRLDFAAGGLPEGTQVHENLAAFALSIVD